MNQIEKFEKLCTQIFFHKGTFNFPFDAIQHNGEFETIVKDIEYPIFESKMENLLKLINNDMDKINLDTQDLWEVI
jgi:hypothetical protein